MRLVPSGRSREAPVTGPSQDFGDATIAATDSDMSYTTIVADDYTPAAAPVDPTAQVPYLSFETPQGSPRCAYITYEDATSIAAKGAWARGKGLNGAIVWTINQGHDRSAPAGQRDALLRAARGLRRLIRSRCSGIDRAPIPCLTAGRAAAPYRGVRTGRAADAGFASRPGIEAAPDAGRKKGADMNAIARRLAIGMMALSLAIGAAAGFVGHASAMPIGSVGADGDCSYAGQTYSEGSVITMGDGKNYKCHDGHWDPATFTTGGSRYPVAPIGSATLGS